MLLLLTESDLLDRIRKSGKPIVRINFNDFKRPVQGLIRDAGGIAVLLIETSDEIGFWGIYSP